jgi:NAD(P)-dependent dehydrogenase (short-subunit alcohol dehydrogenase family)
MRIAVIGATGTIGSAVVETLSNEHEVIAVGHKSGKYTVDISSQDSIRSLYKSVGKVDAVVSCAGQAAFKPLGQLADDDWNLSLGNKLMGQVHLVTLGTDSIRDGGSFTLTSGVLAQEPMVGGTAISLVNSGLEGFTRSAALELPRGIRINVVSPPWVSETLKAMGQDPSHGLPASVVAKAYVKSVTGRITGQVIDARKA